MIDKLNSASIEFKEIIAKLNLISPNEFGKRMLFSDIFGSIVWILLLYFFIDRKEYSWFILIILHLFICFFCFLISFFIF